MQRVDTLFLYDIKVMPSMLLAMQKQEVIALAVECLGLPVYFYEDWGIYYRRTPRGSLIPLPGYMTCENLDLLQLAANFIPAFRIKRRLKGFAVSIQTIKIIAKDMETARMYGIILQRALKIV